MPEQAECWTPGIKGGKTGGVWVWATCSISAGKVLARVRYASSSSNVLAPIRCLPVTRAHGGSLCNADDVRLVNYGAAHAACEIVFRAGFVTLFVAYVAARCDATPWCRAYGVG